MKSETSEHLPLVDAGVVAQILGVQQRTVNTWARAGRIPYVRISAKTFRYDLNDVLETLKKGST